MAISATIVSPCKNRNTYLYDVLPSWLELGLPILVIDYSSKIPVTINHRLVTVLRFEGYDHFNLAHALNIGCSQVDTDIILRMDTDCSLRKESVLPSLESLGENEYRPLRLNWKNIGTSSTALRTKHFHDINGYQEFCEGWGYEDVEFNQRLHYIGVHHNFKKMDMISMKNPEYETVANYQHDDPWFSNLLNIWKCQAYANHVDRIIGNYKEKVGQQTRIHLREHCVKLRDRTTGQSLSPLDLLLYRYPNPQICHDVIFAMKLVSPLNISCFCRINDFCERFAMYLESIIEEGLVYLEGGS